jgi:hypothetical protein
MAWQSTSLGFNVIPCLFCYIISNSRTWWCHEFWWHCPMDVPNMLDLVGVREQFQVDFHDNGSIILEESWAIIKIIAIDIQNNPIVGRVQMG